MPITRLLNIEQDWTEVQTRKGRLNEDSWNEATAMADDLIVGGMDQNHAVKRIATLFDIPVDEAQTVVSSILESPGLYAPEIMKQRANRQSFDSVQAELIFTHPETGELHPVRAALCNPDHVQTLVSVGDNFGDLGYCISSLNPSEAIYEVETWLAENGLGMQVTGTYHITAADIREPDDYSPHFYRAGTDNVTETGITSPFVK